MACLLEAYGGVQCGAGEGNFVGWCDARMAVINNGYRGVKAVEHRWILWVKNTRTKNLSFSSSQVCYK
jgi:hypothetical protein